VHVLQAVGASVAEDEQVSAERVGLEAMADEGEQAVEAQAHVHGVGAVPQLDGRGEAQHGGPPRASSKERTKARSQPGARRRTAPPGRTSSTAAGVGRRTGSKRGPRSGPELWSVGGGDGAARRRFQE